MTMSGARCPARTTRRFLQRRGRLAVEEIGQAIFRRDPGGARADWSRPGPCPAGSCLDAVFGQQAMQRLPVDAGRLRRLRDVPPVPAKQIGEVALREGLEPGLTGLGEGQVLARHCRGRSPSPPDVLRKIPSPDHGAIAERARPLDHVLELAHVAGPGVGLERAPAPRASIPSSGALAVRGRSGAGNAARAAPTSPAPLAQRRQGDRDHVEPVEEILAELALPDQLREVAVGRGRRGARPRS